MSETYLGKGASPHSILHFCDIVFVCVFFNFVYNYITLTVLHHTIPYSRKLVRLHMYVINAGPIYVRKHWPGSITGVAWHGCSRDQGERGPGFDSGGNRLFMGCQLKMRWAR